MSTNTLLCMFSIFFKISCTSLCVVSQFTMDSVDDAAHRRTGGSMVTITPIDNLSVLVITVDKYLVEGIYINEDNLDVSMMQ